MSAGQLRRHEIGKVTALTNPLSGHGAAVKAAHGAIARLKHRGVDVVEIVGGDRPRRTPSARRGSRKRH